MNAVDTNVLFYAHDQRYPEKQRVASELIATVPDGTLVWQVACEYLWASRKLEPFGYSFADAAEDIRSLRLVWNTVLPEWTALDRMERLKKEYSLSLRANIDETVLLVVITEQGENRNQCEEQRNLFGFSHGFARRGT